MEACCAGQTEVVRELLKAGADINAESDSRNTPLIYASTAGKLEVSHLWFFLIKILKILTFTYSFINLKIFSAFKNF